MIMEMNILKKNSKEVTDGNETYKQLFEGKLIDNREHIRKIQEQVNANNELVDGLN